MNKSILGSIFSRGVNVHNTSKRVIDPPPVRVIKKTQGCPDKLAKIRTRLPKRQMRSVDSSDIVDMITGDNIYQLSYNIPITKDNYVGLVEHAISSSNLLAVTELFKLPSSFGLVTVPAFRYTGPGVGGRDEVSGVQCLFETALTYHVGDSILKALFKYVKENHPNLRLSYEYPGMGLISPEHAVLMLMNSEVLTVARETLEEDLIAHSSPTTIMTLLTNTHTTLFTSDRLLSIAVGTGECKRIKLVYNNIYITTDDIMEVKDNMGNVSPSTRECLEGLGIIDTARDTSQAPKESGVIRILNWLTSYTK